MSGTPGRDALPIGKVRRKHVNTTRALEPIIGGLLRCTREPDPESEYAPLEL